MADTLKQRPQFRNIHVSQIVAYRLPPAGIVSILHRVSGVLLFLALPLLLLALQYSLRSIETYTQLMDVLQHPLSKLVSLGLLWAFLHHFCAGIRYLAIDLHLASSLAKARASSRWVLGVSLVLTVLIGVKLC